MESKIERIMNHGDYDSDCRNSDCYCSSSEQFYDYEVE